MARAFDRGKLLLSQKLTAAAVNAYLAVQRMSADGGQAATAYLGDETTLPGYRAVGLRSERALISSLGLGDATQDQRAAVHMAYSRRQLLNDVNPSFRRGSPGVLQRPSRCCLLVTAC